VDPGPDMDPDPDPQHCLADTQGDINEETVIALRSIQASFITMNSRPGKNSGFPHFDGACLGYFRFGRR
jgi:hypothetical protein